MLITYFIKIVICVYTYVFIMYVNYAFCSHIICKFNSTLHSNYTTSDNTDIITKFN